MPDSGNTGNIQHRKDSFRQVNTPDGGGPGFLLGAGQQGRYDARFTPEDGSPVPQPDWATVPTAGEPCPTEEAFEAEIKKQAALDFESGHMGNSVGYSVLLRAYMRTAAPDRRAVFEECMERTGGRMNAGRSFFDAQGQEIMSYNAERGSYTATITTAEAERLQQFTALYRSEYNTLKRRAEAAAPSSGLDIRA